MTDFNELTDEQRVALTDAEINRYKNLEAAENGTPIPGPQPPVFAEEKVPADMILHTVSGMAFENREDAVEVRKFLADRQVKMRKTSYDYSVGYDSLYVEAVTDDIIVAEEACYSVELFNRERVRLSTYKERKDEADTAQRGWREMMTTYEKTCAWINGEIAESRSRVNQRTDNQRRFDEYLELANGDANRAWTFFIKADLDLTSFRPVGAPDLSVPS